jgi:hypothetical protein
VSLTASWSIPKKNLRGPVGAETFAFKKLQRF